ncbi:hypothetical protein Slin15195_G109630 [Septoria linicola]|uniref:Uncharacterized protein n=1 Tax=Septoria linicola TaxID=215465 RepID=A0A9Q9EPG2_9PEZI|nr:hypothetical protein Slin14017_G107980 [Septoria linicola]USW57644.1 hypothetical protein Slin15195_G109630 [Septoria linicola]
MKVRSQAAAALAVAGVSAQTPSAYPGDDAPLSYVTVTYDNCPTASIQTMITVTNGVTVTYCPECHHDQPTPKPTKPGYTTVYTTTYSSVCETGLVPVTHTITETCDEPEPTWTPGPSHVPQGYTTTVKECTACDGGHKTKPVLVTVTEPCDCEATSGTSLGPKPTPTNDKPKPTGDKPEPTGDKPAPSGSKPTDDEHVPTGPGATNPTAAPYPTPSTTTKKCPGPDCVATGTGNLPAPPADSTTPGGSTPPEETDGTTPPPYTGAAASYSSLGFAALSIVIGALAFAL